MKKSNPTSSNTSTSTSQVAKDARARSAPNPTPVHSPIDEAALRAESLVRTAKEFRSRRQDLVTQQQKQLAELEAQEQRFWSEQGGWLESFASERLTALNGEARAQATYNKELRDNPASRGADADGESDFTVEVPVSESKYRPSTSIRLATGEIGFEATPTTLKVEDEAALRQWVLEQLPDAGTWHLALDGHTLQHVASLLAGQMKGPALTWYTTHFVPHIPMLLQHWLDSDELPDGCRPERHKLTFFVR